RVDVGDLDANARDRGRRVGTPRAGGGRRRGARVRRSLARVPTCGRGDARHRRLLADAALPALARPERCLVLRARPSLRAFVTGAGGQDGSYLVELLRERSYDVLTTDRGDADLQDADVVVALLREAAPGEVYNLASPSFVPQSWDDPVETAN